MAIPMWQQVFGLICLLLALLTSAELKDVPPDAVVPRALGAGGSAGTLEFARDSNGSITDAALLGRADPPGTPGVDQYGPLINYRGCFYCKNVNTDEMTSLRGRRLINYLSTDKMMTLMRISNKEDLRNKCVFYTASTTKPNPQYLSEQASVWACSKNKFSIWVCAACC